MCWGSLPTGTRRAMAAARINKQLENNEETKSGRSLCANGPEEEEGMAERAK
jgi:hypothetical protein